MNTHRSMELNELFASLSKAQAEIKVAEKDSDNPFFKSKYANLKAVIEASRPALCKNGLAVIQQIVPNENGIDTLVTMLCHSSGQWMSSQMKITPAKPDIQSLGSYITYLRRYSYSSLIGVYDGFEDDDGNEAMEVMPNVQKQPVSVNHGIQKTTFSDDLITDGQVKLIKYKLGYNNDLLQDVLKKYGINDIQSMRKCDVNPAIEYITSKQ